MSGLLRRAEPGDIARILPLVEAYHEFIGITQDADTCREAVAQLLAAPEMGRIFVLGPSQAPIGYIAISFGFSIKLGGRDAVVDEFFIREKVRGKGFGSRVLAELPGEMAASGVVALHLDVDRVDDVAQRLYRKAGFSQPNPLFRMTRRL